jgi:hypothetical protein
LASWNVHLAFWWVIILFVCLFVYSCLNYFFNYLATVTIIGYNTANLVQCLALMAFSSEGSFYHAIPTVTQDLGLYSLIRRTGTDMGHIAQRNSNRGCKDHQIFAPLLKPLHHAGGLVGDEKKKPRCVCETQMPPRVTNSIDNHAYIKAFEK